MSQTIAVLSQKGGTGKTTAVRTLADALRRSGVRTLAVDLDPQGNLSDYFDLPPDVEPTIADVLSGRASAAEAVREELIPANLSLAEAELMLGGKMGRELTLRRALSALPGEYELILIDCPPSLGRLGAHHCRGAVFRAAGSRAGDGGGRTGPRQPQPEADAVGRAAQPRRHAHRALARGHGLAEGTIRRAGVRHGHPRLDRICRVGRAGAVDPRPPPGPRRGLRRARRRDARPPAGADGRAHATRQP